MYSHHVQPPSAPCGLVFVNLPQIRVILKEDTSFEELPPAV